VKGARISPVRATVAAISLAAAASRVEAAPLQYLTGAGVKATPVVALTWGVLIISVAVIVIIGVLLIVATGRRPSLRLATGERGPILLEESGLRWVWIGVGLSAVVMLLTIVWTVKVLAGIQAPGSKPAVTIEVTGRQWWWQAHYLSDDPTQGFMTANELHIPAGQPVRLKLMGGDVIHSFWVPQLAGKMDAIPGQVNETWIEASNPGTYLGQCTEYCGQQHAHMALRVIADTPDAFRAWWAHQLTAPQAVSGRHDFEEQCGRCHAVRGTAAAGTLGPNLSHLMQRRTIAAGLLPNDAPDLDRWIADPQGQKPGVLMPAVKLSDDQRARIVLYLTALQ
jgi:cytochrome c oxidase subunit 2